MYNSILVPLDGSKRAEKILPHVEELARHFSASILLLSVIEPIPPMRIGEGGYYVEMSLEVINRLIDESTAYLAGIAGEFEGKNLQAKYFIEQGAVVATIIDVAERENVDMIALASHGRSGLSRMFYGSVAAGILQRIDRPLLLIRSQESDEG